MYCYGTNLHYCITKLVFVAVHKHCLQRLPLPAVVCHYFCYQFHKQENIRKSKPLNILRWKPWQHVKLDDIIKIQMFVDLQHKRIPSI